MEGNLKVLFIGDVVGKPGLDKLTEGLPSLIEKYKANFVIVNGENSFQGKGITEEEANIIFAAGAHVITTGNHVWDNWRSKPLLSANDCVIRPFNYPPGNAGRGFKIYKINGIDIAVVQVQGRAFMSSIDCPFRSIDYALNMIGDKAQAIIVDFHADATAEKMAMAWHLDGRVSALLGTHTHIQTADATLLPKGMAYITDVGMTGPYDSVLGMDKEVAMKRFILQTPHKFAMAENDVRIAGVLIEIDIEGGQALRIEPFMEPKFGRSVHDFV